MALALDVDGCTCTTSSLAGMAWMQLGMASMETGVFMLRGMDKQGSRQRRPMVVRLLRGTLTCLPAPSDLLVCDFLAQSPALTITLPAPSPTKIYTHTHTPTLFSVLPSENQSTFIPTEIPHYRMASHRFGSDMTDQCYWAV